MMKPTVTCHCVNVEIQTYDNQVSMINPHAENKPWVCIDTCLATLIGWLWHQGVVTGGCCCGHQKKRPSVAVYPQSIQKMIDLGFEQDISDDHIFYTCPDGGIRQTRQP